MSVTSIRKVGSVAAVAMVLLCIISGGALAAAINTTYIDTSSSGWAGNASGDYVINNGMLEMDSNLYYYYSQNITVDDTESIDIIRLENVSFNSSSSKVNVAIEKYNTSDSSWDYVGGYGFKDQSDLESGDIEFDIRGMSMHVADSDTGTYRVLVEAADDPPITVSDMVVAEANTGPNAEAETDGEATAGLAESFDATNSSDPDGDALTYDWDFDGDGQTDATGAEPMHVFDTAGEFNGTLTVTDEHGATATDNFSVTVSEASDSHEITFEVVNDSTAVDNASINITRTDSGASVGTVSTDENGTATISLADGTYSYVISADGYSDKSDDVVVDGAAQSVSVDFTDDDSDSSGGVFVPSNGTSIAIVIILILAAALVASKEEQ